MSVTSSTVSRTHGVVVPPGLGAQRRFDLHRTDLIDHSCGPHHA
ncbi:hypothetical protein [Xylanimonas allomyrinae]|nr:hypothetical protein [Xylanimonas allomyrinae]